MAININHQTNDLSPTSGTITIGGKTAIASSSTPSDGQVLTWNNTAGEWQSQTSSGGGGGITTGKAIAMAMVFG